MLEPCLELGMSTQPKASSVSLNHRSAATCFHQGSILLPHEPLLIRTGGTGIGGGGCCHRCIGGVRISGVVGVIGRVRASGMIGEAAAGDMVAGSVLGEAAHAADVLTASGASWCFLISLTWV